MSEQNNKLSKEDQDKLLDHNYDGIQELDHPLPHWWTATFVITVVFGIPYWIYYTIGSGPTLLQEHEAKMVVIEKTKADAKARESQFVQTEYDSLVAKDGGVKAKLVFEENCVSCHLDNGIGDIGPNLTDNYWINTKTVTPEAIYSIVFHGIEEKGMPIWSETLSKEDIYLAVSYVMGLKGKNLKGKEPQGELVEN